MYSFSHFYKAMAALPDGIKGYLLFLCCCGSGLKGMSQEPGLTQFSSQRISKEDSAHVLQLISKSRNFEFKSMDTALAMLDTALSLSRIYNFGYGIGNVYIAHSVYAITKGDYERSDSFLAKAYPYCYFASRALRTNRLLALWYDNAGSLAAYQGNYKKAIALEYNVLKLLDEFPADSSIIVLRIHAYNSIGSMMHYVNRQDKAVYYLERAIALGKKHGLTVELDQVYVNLGGTYSGMEQWDKARQYYEQAIQQSLLHDNTFVLQVAYLSMGRLHKAIGNYDTAITFMQKAMLVSDKTNPYMSKITPYINLGWIYFSKNELKQAAHYAKMALQLAEEYKAPQNIVYAHGLLADIYSQTHQWQDAYQHQFAFTQFKDSLDNDNKSTDINQLEIKFRVAEKDKQLAEQQLSLNSQKSALREKNFWIAGISVSALFLTILFIALFLNYRNKKQLQLRNMEINRLKAMMDGEEKERTRIATELHDGVSSQLLAVKLSLSTTLENAKRPLTPEDFRESMQYLDEAMQDLRHTAQNLIPGNGMVRGLKDMIAQFCHKMDTLGDTEVIFQSYGQWEPEDPIQKLSIYRIIQELVQNSLKHAQAHYILVQLNCETDFMGITVQDNGKGFDIRAPHKGQGLDNLRKRVTAFNGSLEMTSNPNGTTMYLELKHPN
jgi:signal transduction histidine kinase